jgi:hypothetical protein
VVFAQKVQPVTVVKSKNENKVDVLSAANCLPVSCIPIALEKPVLYPLHAANGTVVTRSFPLDPKPGDPTDHPHHIGLWFNFENLNGLDFWNNSYAIPANKKNLIWLDTYRPVLETKSGTTGVLTYHANWTNQQKDVILEETTRYEFSGNGKPACN